MKTPEIIQDQLTNLSEQSLLIETGQADWDDLASTIDKACETIQGYFKDISTPLNVAGDEPNIFEKAQNAINEIREKIKGLTFDQASKELDGFNYDGELFDYNWGIDSEYYLVGTIHNKDNQPTMDDDSTLYEIWFCTSMLDERQIISMTEKEIAEQVDRLQ